MIISLCHATFHASIKPQEMKALWLGKSIKKNLIEYIPGLNEDDLMNIDFSKTTIQKINLYKSLNVKRGMWSHDINAWNLHGAKGRELADLYLTKLFHLCKKNKIKFTL